MPPLARARAAFQRGLSHAADALTPRAKVLPLARLRGPSPPAAQQAMVRARAAAVPMADDVLLTRVLGRYKLLVDAGDFAHAPHLLVDGYWEWATTAWLLRHLLPGDRFVDGGAGYGYFSLLAADLVGPQGHVAAYEPNPRLALLCTRSLSLNGFAGRATVVEAALATGVGAVTLRLRVPIGDPLGGRVLVSDLAAGRATGRASDGTAVARAVALAEAGGLAPDVVKLDVPGSEEAAWRGLRPLFAAHPRMRVLLAFEAARCLAPEALLAAVAAVGPLRRLDAAGVAQPCDAAMLLADGESMLLIGAAGKGV